MPSKPSRPSTLSKPGVKKTPLAVVPPKGTLAPASITYADAGVDISRAEKSKQRIKFIAQRTFNKNVLSEIGGFGGLFRLDTSKFSDPVLVSSADGVGTKLKIAIEMNMHQTIGADLVNHCVNDIAVQGATPLFFLDYFATGKLDLEVSVKVIEGLADACKHNGCALIGGETAEMPGLYAESEYDLAGFIVGVVDRANIITGAKVKVGDVLLGLPSTGLHTNGYSLARKLLFEVAQYSPEQYVNELKGKVGAELMRTHKSYWHLTRKLIDVDSVSAMAHITGGGITDNLPRILPKGTSASVEVGSWPVLPIFSHMQQIGNVPEEDMMRTFNMGIGMIVVVPADKYKKAMSIVERTGEKAYNIGRIVKGDRKVIYQ